MGKHKSRAVVNAIIDHKSSNDKQWRPHPDCPELEEARQYKCLDFDRERNMTEQGNEKRATLTANMDQEAVHAIMPCFRGGQSQTSSAGVAFADEAATRQEQKEKLQAEKRKMEEEKKDDMKRLKELPLSGVSHAIILDIDRNTTTNDTKDLANTTMAARRTMLDNLKERLETATEHDAAYLVLEAPTAVDGFKQEATNWRNPEKAFSTK